MIIMLIMQAADFAWQTKFIDNFLQVYQHQFASFSPFCKDLKIKAK